MGDSLEAELDGVQHFLNHCSLTREDVKQCIDDVFTEEGWVSWRRAYWFVVQSFAFLIKLLFLAIVLYFLIVGHVPTQRFLFSHSQGLIYPFMREIRLWTLPILKWYPWLSQIHEEQCLVENPFYSGNSVECWPCHDIRTLVDLTSLQNYSKAYVYNAKPFITRDVLSRSVSMEDLISVYTYNRQVLKEGTTKFVTSTSKPDEATLDSFMNNYAIFREEDVHVQWRVGRVDAVRVIRKLFLKPHFVPENSEVALQRYLFISGSEAAAFHLPLTDFANVWLAQGQGYRLIALEPVDLCKSNCSSISVLLRPRDVMYYNWQFYRPRSIPARFSKELSITFMGSFY